MFDILQFNQAWKYNDTGTHTKQLIKKYLHHNDSVLLGYDAVSMGYHVQQIKATTLPQNVGIQLPTDTASYPKRTKSSTTPLRKPPKTHNSISDTVLHMDYTNS
jgi:hypothetical protein